MTVREVNQTAVRWSRRRRMVSRFQNISIMVLIVQTPVWMGNCMEQKKKQRFYVAAFDFEELQPCSALYNHAYKNKIWSHSKSSHRVVLRV